MCLGYTGGCNSGEVGSTKKFLPGWQNSEISLAAAERQDTNVEHDETTQLGWASVEGVVVYLYVCTASGTAKAVPAGHPMGAGRIGSRQKHCNPLCRRQKHRDKNYQYICFESESLIR